MIAVAVLPVPTADFTVGTWSGLPNWQCTRCPYSTVEGQSAIVEHILDRHGEEFQTVEDRAQAAGLIVPKKKGR